MLGLLGTWVRPRGVCMVRGTQLSQPCHGKSGTVGSGILVMTRGHGDSDQFPCEAGALSRLACSWGRLGREGLVECVCACVCMRMRVCVCLGKMVSTQVTHQWFESSLEVPTPPCEGLSSHVGEAIPFQTHPSDDIKDNVHLLLVRP